MPDRLPAGRNGESATPQSPTSTENRSVATYALSFAISGDTDSSTTSSAAGGAKTKRLKTGTLPKYRLITAIKAIDTIPDARITASVVVNEGRLVDVFQRVKSWLAITRLASTRRMPGKVKTR